ncbi:response regulator transcription factor [Rubrivirga sp. IMCC45206]|uniref:response regulator n=1 Tax=Rubrivirga sp. IMCC45206 TaxID=3391614 RepID=UPI003990284E
MPTPIRVVLAEDHTLLRALLRQSLAACPDIFVVGEAETGYEAVRLVRALQPDVVVLDIELTGGLDGVDVAERLAATRCRVLAHSSHSDPVHVAHLLQVGAAGYLSKEAPVGRIGEAVRAVAAGESRWFEPDAGASAPLTVQETTALQHLAAGRGPSALDGALATTAEVAAAVLASLYDKLGASSWYEAVARGWGEGLVGPANRTDEPRSPLYSTRANVPGQASSASLGSYGA